MSYGLMLQDSPPTSPLQVARDRAEPSLITFMMDTEDSFLPTPAVSATNSANATHGTIRIIRRQCDSMSAPSSTSMSSCGTPMTPSLLTHGADLPEYMLAMLDSDPMPMLPPAMMDLAEYQLCLPMVA